MIDRRLRARAVSVAAPVSLQRAYEVVELIAREASLATGCSVAADVAGVGPASNGCQRDAEVAGRLRAREYEPPLAVQVGV